MKSDIYLGKKGSGNFEFSQLPMDIEGKSWILSTRSGIKSNYSVHECSGKMEELDAVKSWIFSCAT